MNQLVITPDDTLSITNSGGAADVTVHYADRRSDGTVLPGVQLTKIAAAATTPVLSAPAAGSARMVREVTVHTTVGSFAGSLSMVRGATTYKLALLDLDAANDAWNMAQGKVAAT
mgnify:CR=1 FL=1